jgi:hypothetical protein
VWGAEFTDVERLRVIECEVAATSGSWLAGRSEPPSRGAIAAGFELQHAPAYRVIFGQVRRLQAIEPPESRELLGVPRGN